MCSAPCTARLTVLVLCGKVLVAGGVTGVAPVRSCWKLPLCSRESEPIPAGSKTDPPLAKAEPISDSGNASVITFLRRKKKLGCKKTATGERSENM